MKTLHVLTATLALTVAPALAQDATDPAPVSFSPTATTTTSTDTSARFATGFASIVDGICSAERSLASVPIGDSFRVDIPGLTDFGLSIRPLCQYAHIVTNATRTLSGVLDGSLRSTEGFINASLRAVAGSIGGSMPTDEVNEVIGTLDAELRAVMKLGPAALSDYRTLLNEALDDLRQRSTDATVARGAERAASDDPRAGLGVVTEIATRAPLLDLAERRLETEILTESSATLIEQQFESNAHQQTIEDTLRIDPTNASGGIAQELETRARSANSVRQSINVLTEGIAAMLRNDAVLTGSVIENLQDSSRQQAITNHQLQVLTTQLIAQEETRIEEQMGEISALLNEERRELTEAVNAIIRTLDDSEFVTDLEPMTRYGFDFCAMFPSQCGPGTR